MTQRRPRLRDDAYLAWLRKKPCAACQKPAPCDAAHVRSASLQHDKEYPGMGCKPDDRWALPLCRSCHTRQHYFGDELAWWRAQGRDPFTLCIAYYRLFGGDGGKPKRKRSTIKPRLPKGQRARIQSRPFPKVHRPMRSTRP